MKPNLFISFSGGETSGFMAHHLVTNRGNYKDVMTIFANTGQENEETLDFVEKCDRHFGLNVVWVEADIQPEKGKGTRHRVVDFETADRQGRKSFEPMIKKYGIPNQDMKHCTRELKENPMYSYVNSVWEKGSYDVAIGIRADEFDRMSPTAKKKGIIYPLVRMGVTKPMINAFWKEMDFRLELKGYEGNCKWCWKKSDRKHVTILRENPSRYDFPLEMEEKYSRSGTLAEKSGKAQCFFRKHRTVRDLKKLASDKSIKNAENDAEIYPDPELDLSSGCTESCEVFGEGHEKDS